jgi:hypothetical protein
MDFDDMLVGINHRRFNAAPHPTIRASGFDDWRI